MNSLLPIAALALTAAALATGLAGCGSEPEPQAVVAPPPPPPPPPPKPVKPAVTSIADLMHELSIDDRIMLAEIDAPATTEERVAVLEFFDAMVRGDHASLRPMLSEADRRQLDALVKSELWKRSTEAIVDITIETGASPYGQRCALAVIDVDGDFQPQLWYYSMEGSEYGGGSGAEFEAVASPPGMMDKLYGDDMIARWHEVLEEEIALGNQPDEDLTPPQVDLSGEGGGGNLTPSGSGNRPGFSPGGGDRRKPSGPPKRPPGPGS